VLLVDKQVWWPLSYFCGLFLCFRRVVSSTKKKSFPRHTCTFWYVSWFLKYAHFRTHFGSHRYASGQNGIASPRRMSDVHLVFIVKILGVVFSTSCHLHHHYILYNLLSLTSIPITFRKESKTFSSPPSVHTHQHIWQTSYYHTHHTGPRRSFLGFWRRVGPLKLVGCQKPF